jgi:hypothetical protein
MLSEPEKAADSAERHSIHEKLNSGACLLHRQLPIPEHSRLLFALFRKGDYTIAAEKPLCAVSILPIAQALFGANRA